MTVSALCGPFSSAEEIFDRFLPAEQYRSGKAAAEFENLFRPRKNFCRKLSAAELTNLVLKVSKSSLEDFSRC